MIVSEAKQALLLEATQNLSTFTSDADVEVKRDYIFVYPDFGTPDGYPEHTAHRFQVVRVIDTVSYEDGDVATVNYVVRAADGWTGEVDAAELFVFDPAADLDLPAGLTIEMDEDGPTEEGSIAIKRALIDHYHAAGGIVPVADLPIEFRNLVEAFPAEASEVDEEFDRAPSMAYR